jgi:hypothetical protein
MDELKSEIAELFDRLDAKLDRLIAITERMNADRKEFERMQEFDKKRQMLRGRDGPPHMLTADADEIIAVVPDLKAHRRPC